MSHRLLGNKTIQYASHFTPMRKIRMRLSNRAKARVLNLYRAVDATTTWLLGSEAIYRGSTSAGEKKGKFKKMRDRE